jgi:hypothetical protein
VAAGVGAAVVMAAAVAVQFAALAGGYVQAGGACGDSAAPAVGSNGGEGLGGVVVAATVYFGNGPGAYGAGLAGHMSFAELGLQSESDSDRAHADRLGEALGLGGPLAPFTRLLVRAPNGRSVIAEKRDVGMGGPPIDGHPRAIDLWSETRRALGLGPNWSGLLTVAPAGSAAGLEAAAAGDLTAAACAAVFGASGLAVRIVAEARGQVGVSEDPPGSNCTIYGPCEQWCALFVTWVWRHAGVPIGSLAFSGALYGWATQRHSAYPPDVAPRPGWAALFGSGPTDASTSKHAAIVESVAPDGQITLINGNFAGAVTRTGPCLPAKAQLSGSGGCDEPGPIYGYAAPE